VFNGAQSAFPSGIFSNREIADAWIHKYSLTGTLTPYPLDVGMYDHALAAGSFSPKKPEHATGNLIGSFRAAGSTTFIMRTEPDAQGRASNLVRVMWRTHP
jgi:hypothetical protein